MPVAGTKLALKMVPLKGFSATYAFRTSIDGASATALGHVAGTDAQGKVAAGAVVGANSPKPPRAAKKTAGKGSESSFFDFNKLAAIKADGWTVTAGNIAVPSVTELAIPVYVELVFGDKTIRYAWLMSKAQLTVLGTDAPNLGIETVTDDNFNTVMFGVNNPKPKRAQKILENGGKVTSYVATAAEDSLPTGWSMGGGKRLSFGI